MEKIVIAGGTSFIARHLLRQLDATKHQVTAIVRRPEQSRTIAGVNYIQRALAEYDSLGDQIAGCDIYLPFVWDGTQRAARDDASINEASYRAVFQSIKKMVLEHGCRKVILPGTCQEYGNDGRPIDEETPYGPQSPYGAYKRRLYEESLAFCRQQGATLLTLRMFSVYGADDRAEKMLNVWLRGLLANEALRLTEGIQMWSFLHVDDAARAFKVAIEEDLPEGCYNLAAMEQRRLRDFVEEMKRIAGSESAIDYGAVPYAGGRVPHVIFTSRKMGAAFSWLPRISFADGIVQMVRHFREEYPR